MNQQDGTGFFQTGISIRFLWMWVPIFLISGCGSSPIRHSELTYQGEGYHETEPPGIQLSEANFDSIREIEEELLSADAELEEKSEVAGSPENAQGHNWNGGTSRATIPVEINERVRNWIHYFTVKDRARFHRFLQRGNAYKSLVQGILKKNKIPADLFYLAMIESGFVTHAQSSAKAVGVWQFIRGTGLRYGLRQNRDLDERRDIIRATEAASQYLRNLYTAFQSWYLAMAAYNAGEGRILSVIMKGGSRDYWELVERKALPPETRDYVPKILAAIIIGKHPEKYGFRNLETEVFPEVVPAIVAGGVNLNEIARKTDLSVSDLKRFNPHLIRGRTPQGYSEYPIWIPKGKQGKHENGENDDLSTVLASFKRNEPAHPSHTTLEAVLKQDSPRSPSRSKRLRVAYQQKPRYHRVRTGENLHEIAKRYGLSLRVLKKINHLRSNRIQAGRRLLVSSGNSSRSG